MSHWPPRAVETKTRGLSAHRHLFQQARGISALLGFVLGGPGPGPKQLPGRRISTTLDPPSADLIRDFLRFSGGDPASYRGFVPPHLFPQWSLPSMLEVARELPYPPVKVINAGFRLQLRHAIPVGQRLTVTAQLLSVEETERRADITILVETAAVGEETALRAELLVMVPFKRKPNDAAQPRVHREPPRVPLDARQLSSKRLRRDAGLEFAELTGDFNPIHWVPAYARAMRFPSVVLHGFGTSALMFDAVASSLLSGRFRRIHELEVRFEKPVVLPGRVAVFLTDRDEPNEFELMVGKAAGGPALVTAKCRLTSSE